MADREFHGRTRARGQALQLLFQAEATGRTVDEVLAGDYALSEGPLDEYARELALGTDGMRSTLDAIISGASRNWSVGRMPAVDRNLLRIALYEMLCEDDVAVAVTINEVVELAKAYGTDESSRFVNGILGRVASDIERGVDVAAEGRKRAEAAAAAEADGWDDVPDEGADQPEEEADQSDWYGFADDPAYDDPAYDEPPYDDPYYDGEA